MTTLKTFALASVESAWLALAIHDARSWPFSITCYAVMGVGVLGLVVLS